MNEEERRLARRVRRLENVLIGFLRWGAMTQSDRYLHECRFKRALGKRWLAKWQKKIDEEYQR